jgi:hypothetical protein
VTSIEDVSRAIVVLRGHKVLLDAELAALYGATTKRLNEQVRRNRERFPTDFMFQLTAQEAAALRSQSATNRPLARKLDELESRLQTHDEAITGILRTLRGLMNPPASERRGIGFTADLKEGQ